MPNPSRPAAPMTQEEHDASHLCEIAMSVDLALQKYFDDPSKIDTSLQTLCAMLLIGQLRQPDGSPKQGVTLQGVDAAADHFHAYLKNVMRHALLDGVDAQTSVRAN